MRFYSNIPHRYASRLLADILVVTAIVLLALLGLSIRETVNRLVVVPQGVRETGGAVQSGFHDAADAVGDVPIIGGDLSDGFESAGRGSGGRVESLGEEGIDRTHRLADLLGLLVFGLPAAAILALVPASAARARTPDNRCGPSVGRPDEPRAASADRHAGGLRASVRDAPAPHL
jgi:hypothetical protein